jgi:dephospho-CoA kinase
MIIGLTGSFGAGKGAVAEYLIVKHGFSNYSVRSFLVEEIQRRGMPVNRDSMIAVANDLRAKNGPAYLIEALYKKASEVGGNIIIESLRAVAEVRKMKELGGIVIGVDAEPHLRYERVLKRGLETDHVSYEQWLAQEQAETNPSDQTKQDIFGALKESTFILQNNGSVEELHRQIDEALASVPQK